jgi:O-antigen/teichoic acid export membrane protein
MLFAAAASGGIYALVHKCADSMSQESKAEYGAFVALLGVLAQMTVPAIGLQSIFVQETVMADNEERRGELAGAMRSVLRGTFLIWLACAAVVFIFQSRIQADYKITNPLALWATAALGLVSLWTPVFSGILQGRENFLWLGLNSILSASSRLLLVVLFVVVLGGGVAAAMVGVLLSMSVPLFVGGWQTRALWRVKPAPFVWRPWLKKVLPLTLGLGTTTFMFTWDTIVAQRFLAESGLYGAAATLGRAVMFLIAPMTVVMFPKVVRAAARAEQTNILWQALGLTTLLAAGAALGLTLFAEMGLRFLQGPSFVSAAPLVRWFVWAALPLTASSVLLNNLMARERYQAVPWLVATALAYALALWILPALHATPLRVIQTMGVFTLVYFGVCLVFTGRQTRAAGAA